MESNLDKGNTLSLFSAIISNIPKGQLKDTMVNNSPLSDTVLIEFIKNSGHLQPGHFKEVLVPNLPVSDKVKPHLDIKLTTLPNGIANEMRSLQVFNPGYRTLTAISRDVSYAKMQRQLSLNQAIRDAVKADTIAFVIDLLEQENTEYAIKLLVGTYLADSNLSAATAKLNALPLNSAEDSTFFLLYSMFINLSSAGKTLWEMDSAQEQLVRDIAALCPASIATMNARAALELVFREITPDCPQPQFKTSGNGTGTDTLHYPVDKGNFEEAYPVENEMTEAYYLGDNIPNPFSSSTLIPYYLPEGSEGIITISGKTGALLREYRLKRGLHYLEIAPDNILQGTLDFSDGLYYYTIFIDGLQKQTKKMMKIK